MLVAPRKPCKDTGLPPYTKANMSLMSVVVMTLCACSWVGAVSSVMFGTSAGKESVSVRWQQSAISLSYHLVFILGTGS